MGFGPLSPQDGTSAAKIFIPIVYHHTMGVGPVRSASLSLLSIPSWHLLYVFSYKIFVRLFFRWFSVMVAL